MPRTSSDNDTNSTVSTPNENVASAENPTSTAVVADDPIARKPTIICCTGPADPPSVTSTGVLRVRLALTSAAETSRVAPLSRIATCGGPASSMTAPRAGPTITVVLSSTLRSALAEARSRSGTSSGVIPAAAGS